MYITTTYPIQDRFHFSLYLIFSSLPCLLFSKMAYFIPQTFSLTLLFLVAFVTFISAIEAHCSDAVFTSLSSSGFTLFAQALHAQNQTTDSKSLTYFVPPDTSLLGHPLNVDTFHYHVSTAGALPYKFLLTLPQNTTLPTLHNTTLVVDTDGERLSLNDVLVSAPNIYVEESCVVHGVESPLVPIPSSMDDHPLPKTKTTASLFSPKHYHRRFKELLRFIRRAHRPIFDVKNGEHDDHP
ncbi:uncharacterized protein LOC132800062 [Ziziphus jujuba]|uniref:Uncharacterized protein LOC132800062 n=1 Tax=Ziziphus jujuba TaxID=326968 RepID=A0ABM3ZWW7_ZIZJJ|nr:uncharacterized protein LOC132800062 [Ziziphus jujuba]